MCEKKKTQSLQKEWIQRLWTVDCGVVYQCAGVMEIVAASKACRHFGCGIYLPSRHAHMYICVCMTYICVCMYAYMHASAAKKCT